MDELSVKENNTVDPGYSLEAGVLRFDAGTRVIPDEIFYDRADIIRVIIPEGVTDIGAAAFAECKSLEEVELPSSLIAIHEGAFLNCTSLRSFKLPEGLKDIYFGAFWGTAVEAVVVPKSVEHIGEQAFWDCEQLKRADVLNPDVLVDDNAFGSCYNLTEGYMAFGRPQGDDSPPAKLLYSMLWCSCPDRHTEEMGAWASDYIRLMEQLVMERIFKTDNSAALSGLVSRKLLSPDKIGEYLTQALEAGKTELTTLLLKAAGNSESLGSRQKDEFEL